jgi:methyl-accepting chemotaxis protein
MMEQANLLMDPPATDLSHAPCQADDHHVGSELARYVPKFQQMSRQLRQTSGQIESSVVAVCSNFQAIAERARSTVSRTTGFLQSDGSTDSALSFEDLIEQCSKGLVKILKTTEEAGEISQRAIERVQKIDAASEEINSSIAKLERIAQENKMLAMNARIEAAHAGAAGAGFAVVAVEVVSQTERAKAVTAALTSLVRDLRGLAGSTVKDLKQMMLEESKRMEQCRADVSQSLAEMQSAYSGIKSVLAGMTDESVLLANDIGAAVRQLQFQDRTGQQIAHVVEDLETLHARLTARFGEAAFERLEMDGFSHLTMYEERVIAGSAEQESLAGDVELF